MGDSTTNTRICRLCDTCIGTKAFGAHVKRKHEIDFIEYAKQFKDDFPKIRNCVICKKLCFSSGKDATCSVKCLAKLKTTWVGDKSPKKGMPCSEETKNKIGSKALQRIKDGIPHGRLGKTFTQESKDKMSKTALLNAAKSDYKNGMAGKTHTPEAIEKIFSHRKMNKLERLVASILDENNIPYRFQFFINKNGVCKSYDFKLKDSNIIIEVDGDFWHGNEKSKVKFDKYETVRKNDELKTMIACEEGYTLIRLWESDIKKDSSIIINSINQII